MNWVTSRTLTSDDFRNNAVPDARPGDIIAYKWDGGNRNQDIDHVSLVVNIASGNYPEVAEAGTNKLPSLYVSYPKRGWTYSVNDGTWLQKNHPKVTAILLHINF
jgi:hypothetical protein